MGVAANAKQLDSRTVEDTPAKTAWSQWAAPLCVSRLIVLGIFAVASVSVVVPGSPMALRFHRPSAEMFYSGDTRGYLAIAQHGYQWPNQVFFPLYPALLRIHPTIGWGVLISNVCFALAVVLMWRLGQALGFDANNAIWLLVLFPGSHFFSVVMTESLFLLLSVASLLAARRQRWWVAGALGALASATRVPGIFVWPMLALESRKFRPALLLPPLGLLGFMAYLWRAMGDPLAFIHAQRAFGHGASLSLLNYVRHPAVFHTWAFYPLYLIVTVLWIWAAVWLFKRRSWSMAAFTMLSLAVSMAGAPLAPNRYILSAFPVFFVFGEELRREYWKYLATAGMTALALLYAGGYGLALT